MKMLFPNYTDKEGFLFYPVAEIIKARDEFGGEHCENNLSNVIIFANYLHKSWWYGFKIKDDGSYEIGIIPYSNAFVSITNSLAGFIQLYLEDASKLYEF